MRFILPWLILPVLSLALAACQPVLMPEAAPGEPAAQEEAAAAEEPDEAAPAAGPTAVPEQETAEPAGAANADVTYVRAVQAGDGAWTFHVTVAHPDTGWEDYADGWDVLTPDGTVLKPDPDSPFTRLLLHPHENEQPFTRSQSGIQIPADVAEVRVRAHDLVDGYGGREVIVDLTQESGPDFEVERNS